MELIEEIINNLSSDKPDLNNALFKTKVLLHRLGEEHLISWVNSELTGYPDRNNVPQYRIIEISIYGNISNAAWHYSDHPLPLHHLDKDLRKNLETHHLVQSIAVIEGYAQDDKNMVITVDPVYFPILSGSIKGGYKVEKAWGIYSAGAMLQVVTEVRSRLLDFILELSDKLPEDIGQGEMKEKSKEIGTSDLFNNAVFGDNTTIFVGSYNIQNIQNRVIKHDFESLATIFREYKIEGPDLKDLKTAIYNDNGSSEHGEKKFGSNVRSWISSMLTKATESAWNVELGIASSLLANALNSYYGWI